LQIIYVRLESLLMSFIFKRLEISDVILVEPDTYPDERGFFMEGYKESIFKKNGINAKFIQNNFSHSKKGVLRGMHYQNKPAALAKLVSAVKGEIFDVAIDMRKNSPTFGKWVGEILSDKNHRIIYIPEGFAHGLCVLSEAADVSYLMNHEYSPEHERGIIWNDPEVGIKWPIKEPIISKKDQRQPLLKNADTNFVYE